MAKEKRLIVVVGILVVFVIMSIPAVYFFNKYEQTKRELATQKKSSEDPVMQKKEMIDRVAKHVLLPEGEDPTVMTITEQEKLIGQEFFKRAKNGDILLVYSAEKKAILYDPVTDKILEIGPVAINETPTPQPEQINTPYRVHLVNGNNSTGSIDRYETLLKVKMPKTIVVSKSISVKNDYKTSLLIDVGNHLQEATKVATLLGAQVNDLPQGESLPEEAYDVDFVIIVGTN